MPITLPSDPSDGQVAPASWGDAVRTALSYLAGIVSPGDAGTWTTWTPSWTNLTVGSGTVTAKYHKIGRSVHFLLRFTYGSGSAVGTQPSFTLPVQAATAYAAEWPIGGLTMVDAGVNAYAGYCQILTSTTAIIRKDDGTGQFAAVTATVPFTWGSGDYFMVSGTYEAAT